MNEKIDISNIDLILKYITSNLEEIESIRKLDGITLEIIYKESIDKKRINNLKALCKKIKLQPVSIELNSEKDTNLALQFPEYESTFSKEELDKLYIESFKWSIDSLYANDLNGKVNDEVVRKSRDLFINQCLTRYYRSYKNPYKCKFEDFINDQNLIHDLRLLYFNFSEPYLIERKK